MKKRVRWTTEMLRAEALKYETRKAFYLGSSSAYAIARNRDMLNDGLTCAHMSGNTLWSEDLIRKEALKFNTRREFLTGSPSAYRGARLKNILDSVCEHMEVKLNYWDETSIRAEAIKYKTKVDFSKGSPKAYGAALKRGLMSNEEIVGHMEAHCIYWDKESIRTEALKYKTKVAFRNGNQKAYDAALTRGLMTDESIVGHMEAQKVYWTEESIRDDALRFNSLADYQNNSSGYQAARLRNMIDDGITTAHMEVKKIYWTEDSIREEALKYKFRGDFYNGSTSAYVVARIRGLLDSVCSHMEYADTGFNLNKSAILYYIKFETETELPVYKIGITNFTTDIRIKGMNAKQGTKATVLKELWFENGAEARELEKELHKEFKEHRYYGDAILGNGNTELFVIDVLQYDTQQAA